MSVIIQSELDVVELSSDEESIRVVSNRPSNSRDRSSSPDTQCPICLDGLTNQCYTDSCLHLFCFECLKRWSISEASCPLCKQIFNRIFHSFDDHGDHQIYNVPPRLPAETTSSMPVADFTMSFFMNFVRRHEGISNIDHLPNFSGQNFNDNGRLNDANRDFIRPSQSPITISGQAVRIQVYTENAWALPLPDILSGRFRECNLANFRNNPAQVHRLRPFIIRDLIVIREIARLNDDRTNMWDINISSVTNMIIRSLTSFEIREGFMVNILRPFLHCRALHFCHEFYNFANSPYNMSDYDRFVQFSLQSRTASLSGPPSQFRGNQLNSLPFAPSLPPIPWETPGRRVFSEIIILDSDNEEPEVPIIEVIDVDSNSDDSDVEILSHSVRPIESQNSASIDQPSTSTGIRESLDQPSTSTGIRESLDQPSTSTGIRESLDQPSTSTGIRGSLDQPSTSTGIRGSLDQPSTSTGIRESLDQPSTSTGIRESLDQPSTSTGIRESLDQANNRYNLRRQRFYERFGVDSSSDDEEPINATQQENQKKKKKLKLNNDSRSESQSINRNHSYSESSSSSVIQI